MVAKPIKITIKGSDDTGTDAPTVDDFLGQVRDFLEVLRGVEKAVSDDGENEIVWRVTNAQMNSPIWVELTPFAKNPAIYVDARADKVERVAMEGLRAIRRGEQRPRAFTDEVLKKARAIHARVINGLADTTIGFDEAITDEPIVIDRQAASEVEAAHQAALSQGPQPYRELGSIEGFVSKAELDGFGRAILRFRSRLNGEEIKAVATGRAFHQLESLRLSDVWRGIRVRVYGVINYRSLGDIQGLDATGIEVLDQIPLPGPDDIIDEHFTGGLRSEDFLAELRNA
jgi:hypothetical protein